MNKMITDKMTINFNVFSPFIEDIIVSNMNDTLVITMKRSSRKCGHTYLEEFNYVLYLLYKYIINVA